MKISVVVCTYNGEKYIEEQLASILEQNIKPDEVIIYDDGSTDNTVELVNMFISRNNLMNYWRIKVNEKNLGYQDNFIEALKSSNGDIVFLSDQDDIFFPKKFKIMKEFFEKNNKCLLLSSKFENIDENGNKISKLKNIFLNTKIKKYRKITFEYWLKTLSFPGFSMCVSRKIINKIDGYNRIGIDGHDQVLCLIALDNDGFFSLNRVLNKYRVHSSNVTNQKRYINQDTTKIRIEQKKLELSFYDGLCIFLRNNLLKGEDLVQHKCKILKNRIKSLETKSIRLATQNFFDGAYPIHTILADFYTILRGKK